LYKFKLGTKAAQVARNICKTFRENTVNDCTTQNWFKKFSFSDKTIKDKPLSVINDEEMETLLMINFECQTCQQIARRFNVNEKTVLGCTCY